MKANLITNEIKRKSNKGITLIALIITIIVLLILAGVTIATIAGQDSAPKKAAEAKNSNIVGEAKDAATLLITGYIQDYYEDKYVNSNTSANGILEYINSKFISSENSEAKFITKGNHKIKVEDGNITVADLNENEIITGTLTDKGTINWNESTYNGDNTNPLNPDEQEEQSLIGTVEDFEYTGKVQDIVLNSGKYKLETWGAQGGNGYGNGEEILEIGGKGGYSCGTLTLREPTQLYIYVGGKGESFVYNANSGGGFNGGGNAANTYSSSNSTTYNAGGGGGASDIRIGEDSLFARVIVAGGGGGAANGGSTKGRNPGVGGGTSGGNATLDGEYSNDYKLATGATQTEGGIYGYFGNGKDYSNSNLNGKFGQGGSGEGSSCPFGAGGGGWYGGAASGWGPGSGGSGFVYTEDTASNYPTGCLLDDKYYLTNVDTKSGAEEFASPEENIEKGHSENGHIRITYLDNVKPIKPTGITISNTNNVKSLAVGDKTQLNAKIEPNGATGTIEWKCNPEGAVTFDPPTGKRTTVTAKEIVANGNVTITALIQGTKISSTEENFKIEEKPIPGGTKEATSEKAQAINAKIGTEVAYTGYSASYTGAWEVFYATNNEMFLITKRSPGITYWPGSSPKDSSQDVYTGSEDVKNSGYDYGKNWNSIWLAACTTESKDYNAKETAFLCDYRNWQEYVAEGKATYAVGGPTIELLAAAVAAYGGRDVTNSLTATAGGYNKPDLGFSNTPFDYPVSSNPFRIWLASPSNYGGYKGRDNIKMLFTHYSRVDNDSNYYVGSEFGYRPIVSIPINKVTVNEDSITINP